MATRLLDRVPTEQIRAEARDVHVGRLLLTVLVGVFFAAGWTAGKASLGVAFALAATKVGWTEARKPSGGPRGPA